MTTDYQDDGATEVVTQRPRRKASRPIDVRVIGTAAAGGRMSAVIAAGDRHRRDFILMRKADQPPVRIALPHIPVFKALWSLWSANRVSGSGDPGVTLVALAAWLQARGMTHAPLASAIRSLTKSGALRAVDTHVGLQGIRARYYPTDAGVQAFALAEVLGDQSYVQVGGAPQSWKRRTAGEPKSVFHYANLLNGGRGEGYSESA